MVRRAPRLLVVDPSVVFAEDEGVAEVCRGWPGECVVLRPALEPSAGPRLGQDWGEDAVIVLGSRASVHDDAPWLDDLARWLRPYIAGELDRPVLGVCFGHQLVAHLAGSEVGFCRDDRGKVAGVATTEWTSRRLLPSRRELCVAVSHRERVVAAPPGFRVVGARPDSPIDALEHETRPIFSVQFHPEAREDWLRRRGVAPESADPRVWSDGRALLESFREFAIAHNILW